MAQPEFEMVATNGIHLRVALAGKGPLVVSVPVTTPRVQITLREKHGVPNIVELVDIEMIPVLQLAPYDFGADGRPVPSRPYDEMPDEWYRYWLGSLADSGVTGGAAGLSWLLERAQDRNH